MQTNVQTDVQRVLSEIASFNEKNTPTVDLASFPEWIRNSGVFLLGSAKYRQEKMQMH